MELIGKLVAGTKAGIVWWRYDGTPQPGGSIFAYTGSIANVQIDVFVAGGDDPTHPAVVAFTLGQDGANRTFSSNLEQISGTAAPELLAQYPQLVAAIESFRDRHDTDRELSSEAQPLKSYLGGLISGAEQAE